MSTAASTKTKALLLSAGLGTRLRPYTNHLPKPCIPFWGLPLLHYSLFLLKQTGCKDIAINLHHLPEKIKELTQSPELAEFAFSFSLEKEKPMGSGGAIYYAQKYLQNCEHFYAINGDEVMVPTTTEILNRLRDVHLEKKALATLLVTDHPELMKTLKPVWINSTGLVRGFGEKPAGTETLRPVHYTGYKIFQQKVLKLIPEGETHIFHDVVVPAMKKGEVVATLHDPMTWWETGNFNSLLEAVKDVILSPSHQAYFQKVYAGFEMPYPFKCEADYRYQVAYTTGSSFEPALLRGTVFIDQNVKIKAGSSLENVILNKNTQTGTLKNKMLLPGESEC